MNTMRTQRVVWPLALLATAFLLGCQEQASSPVEPEGPGILLDRFGPHPHGGGSSDSDSGEEFEVALSGGYATLGPQPIKFAENGRRVIVRTDDGAQIQYSVNIDTQDDGDFPFDDNSCVWSGFGDNDDAVDLAASFWAGFDFVGKRDQPRNLLFRVNKKENGFSDGEHRTEARWWIEDDERVMYLVKVGVPGKILADQLSELTETPFVPATGTFDDGTKTVTITGGAVRLSQHNCGAVTKLTAGCGPQAPTEEVACINPPPTRPDGSTDPDAQVFTALVTPKA